MSEESNSAELADSEPVVEPVELPGKRLQAAREDRHLGREEVAHHLHLDVKLIIALEEDDYEKLPSPSYICGYLRSYARLLKLPEDEIVKSYTQGQVISAALLPENVDIVSKKKHTSKSSYSTVMVLVVVLALVFFAFWLFDMVMNTKFTEIQGTEKEINTTTIEEPATGDSGELTPYTYNNAEKTIETDNTSTAATMEPTEIAEFKKNNIATTEVINSDAKKATQNASKEKLLLVYDEDSWTEVVDSDGNRVIYRLVTKGSELSVKGKPPFTILLGNAPGVTVLLNGDLFDHKRYHRDRIAYFRLGLSE